MRRLILLPLVAAVLLGGCDQNVQGTYTWPSGSNNVGSFTSGERNGQGTKYYPDSSKNFGEFNVSMETAEPEKAGEPEMWICSSTDTAEPIDLYLVYHEQDVMLFSQQGGLLHAGTLKVVEKGGLIYLYDTLKMKSGRRKMYIHKWTSSIEEERVMKMQIMTVDGDDSDDFLCR